MRADLRRSAWRDCLVSVAAFLPVLAWWPMATWIKSFVPYDGVPFGDYRDAVQADGLPISLQLSIAYVLILPVYYSVVIWIRSLDRSRALVAAPIAVIGAVGFWVGQLPYYRLTDDNALVDFCGRHLPVWAVLMVVAWSVSRRRTWWWLVGLAIVAFYAIAAELGNQPGVLSGGYDAVADAVGWDIAATFAPREAPAFSGVLDIAAGTALVWLFDVVGVALDRTSREARLSMSARDPNA